MNQYGDTILISVLAGFMLGVLFFGTVILIFGRDK